MSAIHVWLDKQINPIMVKEIYQGFRSRSYVLGYSTALLLCLMGYLTLILPASVQRDTLGEDLFALLMTAMTFIAMILIPMNAGNQMRNDIVSQTLDLIAITHLSPWAIISGRFQAAALKIIILFAFMGPFTVAVFFLGGIGASYIFFSLGLLLLTSLGFCSLVLMLNTLPVFGNRFRALSMGLQVFILIAALTQFVAIGPWSMGNYYARALAFDLDMLLQTMNYLLCSTLLMLFFLRMGADILTPPAVRTFVASKILLSIFLISLCLPIILGLFRTTLTPDDETTAMLATISTFLLYSFCLMWAGQLRTNPAIQPRNLLLALFSDGYTPTLVYLMFMTMLLVVLVYLVQPTEKLQLAAFAAVSLYAFISGVARLFRSLLRPARRTFFSYLSALIFLAVLNIMATSMYWTIREGNPPPGAPSALLAFLPLTWLDEPGLLIDYALPWTPLPLGIGLVAAWLSRDRRRLR